jgi:hypothetical protein
LSKPPTPQLPTPLDASRVIITDDEADDVDFILRRCNNLRPRRVLIEKEAAKPRPTIAKAKTGWKRAPRAKQPAAGQSSRIGQPHRYLPGVFYKREAYSSLAGFGGALKAAGSSIQEEPAAAIAATERITTLTIANAMLTAEVASLNSQLTASEAGKLADVNAAKLVERGMAGTAINEAFQNGMNAAMRILSKKEVRPSSYDFLKGKSKKPSTSRNQPSESDDVSD